MAADEFEGKVYVITGGSQGLGEAIARRFAAGGARAVVISGRNAVRGEHVAEQLSRDEGTQGLFVPADLTDVAQCRAVIARTGATFGRLDGLVNAAGLSARSNILETTPEFFDRMIAVNLRGPFFLMQEAIRLMRACGVEGTIVNILTVAIHGGAPELVGYAASKAALASVTRNTAYALLPDRIRVNGIAPGWMGTPGEDAVQRGHHGRPEGWREEAARAMPFGRLIEPAEIAECVAFLSSSKSGLMTGSIIDFDQKVVGAHAKAPAPPLPLQDPQS